MKATHAPLLVQKSTKASRQTIGNTDQVLSRWVSVLRPDKIACPTAPQLHKKGTFTSKPTLDPHHWNCSAAQQRVLKVLGSGAQVAPAPQEVAHPSWGGQAEGQHLKADTSFPVLHPSFGLLENLSAGELSYSLSAAFFQHLKSKSLSECTCLTAPMVGHVWHSPAVQCRCDDTVGHCCSNEGKDHVREHKGNL